MEAIAGWNILGQYYLIISYLIIKFCITTSFREDLPDCQSEIGPMLSKSTYNLLVVSYSHHCVTQFVYYWYSTNNIDEAVKHMSTICGRKEFSLNCQFQHWETFSIGSAFSAAIFSPALTVPRGFLRASTVQHHRQRWTRRSTGRRLSEWSPSVVAQRSRLSDRQGISIWGSNQ